MNDSFEVCLAHSLRSADRVISQFYTDYLSSVGLRSTQYAVLRVIALSKTTTARQIQDHLVMEQATVSRALKPLIRDGYIEVKEGSNRREKALSLTTAGKKIYQQAKKEWSKAQAELKTRLGDESAIQLIELSRKITDMKRT